MPTKFLLFIVFAACALAQTPRLLVVTGGHAFEPSFHSLFDAYRTTRAVTSEKAFADDIRPITDVVVLYNMEVEIGDGAKANLRAFAESGKGIVILHHALGDYPHWPWWYHEVSGGRFESKATNELPALAWKHDQSITVRPVASHPVLAGIGEFQIVDETYNQFEISPDDQVLLRTDHPLSQGPVAWISPYRKSRVIYVQLGHDHQAWENPGFRRLLTNAISWAAGI